MTVNNLGLLPCGPAATELQQLNGYKVRMDGIHFRNHVYGCEELVPFIGERVTFYVDPKNASRIFVFHRDKYVGVAGLMDERSQNDRRKASILAFRKRKGGR